jgi:nucleoside-diphosphate-sugar epimerase
VFRYADPRDERPGFISDHLAESFLNDGHDVTVLDKFGPF